MKGRFRRRSFAWLFPTLLFFCIVAGVAEAGGREECSGNICWFPNGYRIQVNNHASAAVVPYGKRIDADERDGLLQDIGWLRYHAVNGQDKKLVRLILFSAPQMPYDGPSNAVVDIDELGRPTATFAAPIPIDEDTALLGWKFAYSATENLGLWLEPEDGFYIPYFGDPSHSEYRFEVVPNAQHALRDHWSGEFHGTSLVPPFLEGERADDPMEDFFADITIHLEEGERVAFPVSNALLDLRDLRLKMRQGEDLVAEVEGDYGMVRLVRTRVVARGNETLFRGPHAAFTSFVSEEQDQEYNRARPNVITGRLAGPAFQFTEACPVDRGAFLASRYFGFHGTNNEESCYTRFEDPATLFADSRAVPFRFADTSKEPLRCTEIVDGECHLDRDALDHGYVFRIVEEGLVEGWPVLDRYSPDDVVTIESLTYENEDELAYKLDALNIQPVGYRIPDFDRRGLYVTPCGQRILPPDLGELEGGVGIVDAHPTCPEHASWDAEGERCEAHDGFEAWTSSEGEIEYREACPLSTMVRDAQGACRCPDGLERFQTSAGHVRCLTPCADGETRRRTSGACEPIADTVETGKGVTQETTEGVVDLEDDVEASSEEYSDVDRMSSCAVGERWDPLLGCVDIDDALSVAVESNEETVDAGAGGCALAGASAPDAAGWILFFALFSLMAMRRRRTPRPPFKRLPHLIVMAALLIAITCAHVPVVAASDAESIRSCQTNPFSYREDDALPCIVYNHPERLEKFDDVEHCTLDRITAALAESDSRFCRVHRSKEERLILLQPERGAGTDDDLAEIVASHSTEATLHHPVTVRESLSIFGWPFIWRDVDDERCFGSELQGRDMTPASQLCLFHQPSSYPDQHHYQNISEEKRPAMIFPFRQDFRGYLVGPFAPFVQAVREGYEAEPVNDYRGYLEIDLDCRECAAFFVDALADANDDLQAGMLDLRDLRIHANDAGTTLIRVGADCLVENRYGDERTLRSAVRLVRNRVIMQEASGLIVLPSPEHATSYVSDHQDEDYNAVRPNVFTGTVQTEVFAFESDCPEDFDPAVYFGPHFRRPSDSWAPDPVPGVFAAFPRSSYATTAAPFSFRDTYGAEERKPLDCTAVNAAVCALEGDVEVFTVDRQGAVVAAATERQEEMTLLTEYSEHQIYFTRTGRRILSTAMTMHGGEGTTCFVNRLRGVAFCDHAERTFRDDEVVKELYLRSGSSDLPEYRLVPFDEAHILTSADGTLSIEGRMELIDAAGNVFLIIPAGPVLHCAVTSCEEGDDVERCTVECSGDPESASWNETSTGDDDARIVLHQYDAGIAETDFSLQLSPAGLTLERPIRNAFPGSDDLYTSTAQRIFFHECEGDATDDQCEFITPPGGDPRELCDDGLLVHDPITGECVCPDPDREPVVRDGRLLCLERCAAFAVRDQFGRCRSNLVWERDYRLYEPPGSGGDPNGELPSGHEGIEDEIGLCDPGWEWSPLTGCTQVDSGASIGEPEEPSVGGGCALAGTAAPNAAGLLLLCALAPIALRRRRS